jgi:hypothetical protein
MRIFTCFWMIACANVAATVLATDDAYIHAEANRWTLGTAVMERVVALENGKLLPKSFKNKATGRELISSGAASEEFSLRVGDAKEPITGSTGPWKLIRAEQTKLSQGELQLELTLQRESLLITKSYTIYPGSSIVRQWVTVKNAGNQPLVVVDPGFLTETVRLGEPENLDFHWMTGGENQPGSWMLKTEKLNSAKPRAFDSYEPFQGGSTTFLADGIYATILLNGKPVWPANGAQHVADATVKAAVDCEVSVAAGDKFAFVVNMNHSIGWDTTAFDPTITYDDGETHVASKEFSDKQGQNGWRYQYIEGQQYVDLVYYSGPKQWRKEKDNATGTPFVGVGDQHPDANQDAARVWTVPKAGRVHVAATVCNTGNVPGVAGGYGFRMGSSTYAPWNALLAKDTGDGVVIGWDYFGHWASSFHGNADGSVTAELKVAGHKQTLAPGELLTTPKAFVGLFRDDLDNAGNEVLDWQYRYLWDYTRDKWFPAIRVLGYWMKGTAWGEPGSNVGWVGGNPDMESAFRKVFRVADLMRRIGGDVYHRDWGWWDRAGDWNGPDFRTTGDYLRKSGMGQLIYAFLYTVDPQSKVAKEHPDWVIGETLDMSKPEVVEHIKRQLDNFHDRWGDFEWRNDSTPTCPRNGDDTPLLGQDAGLRQVIRYFLDEYPGSAFQAVNGGGNDTGYDYARYASSVSFSDGAVGIVRNYYASLVLPPDKTSDIPDIWNPANYDKATWRGLLCINFDMTGDTWDPAKVEGLGELIDIYHYLQKHNVVGRWVKVYRPTIAGDPDPTMYFQRLSGDRKKGIIIPKRPAPGPVTIKPKGLLPDEVYTVSFHEADGVAERTGKDLMDRGITIEKMLPGELVYLNLPLHPGSKLDKEPPTAPGNVQKQAATNMSYPGVELTWKPGSDNNWISYYDVYRNGAAIDRVAKGTYYFDHSAGADLAAKYEVRTVDGAGNASSSAMASGKETKPSRIVDDAPTADAKYAGKWQAETGLPPAHAGTLTTSNEPGASVSVAFEGKRVYWFSKLGANAGKAAVSVDGAAAETVDTYSADDIWGVCVYSKDFPAGGSHTLQITVLGQRAPRAKDCVIAIDGFRIEP